MNESRIVDFDSTEGQLVFETLLFNRIMNQLNRMNPGLSAVMIRDAGADVLRKAYPLALKDTGFQIKQGTSATAEVLEGGYFLEASRSHINESTLARALHMQAARLHAPGIAPSAAFKVSYAEQKHQPLGLTFTI
jgi:hypothetical protein